MLISFDEIGAVRAGQVFQHLFGSFHRENYIRLGCCYSQARWPAKSPKIPDNPA